MEYKVAANYILVASDLIPIFSLIDAYKPAATGRVNGPYYAGTISNLKVFVTPNIEAGRFVIGVNGDDMMSSAAVYAPYMPLVPTQLLGYADGGMSQGWSTMYDLQLLNADDEGKSLLLVGGKVVD